MKQKIASIGWDPEYFQTTVRKESRYPLAWRWVKETLQNAVDAKATEIVYTLDKRDKSFEVLDNGVGMTADIVENKFLQIGGSKKSGTSVGGFGDAKKVICFCWEWWELESKAYVSSEMIGQEPVRKLKNGRAGTRIKANLGEYFNVDAAVSYIELCELNVKVKVFVVEENGTRSDIKLTKFVTNKPLESNLAFGDLYLGRYVRSRPNVSGCVIRINGLAMFIKSLPGIKKDMVFELRYLADPKSKDYILNVQREGLDWRCEMALDKVLQMYVSEPHKAERDATKNDNLVTVLTGSGTCQTMTNLMSVRNVTFGRDGYQFDVPENLASAAEALISGMTGAEFMNFISDYEETEGHIELNSDKIPMLTRSHDNVFSDVYPYDFIIKGKTNLRYTSLKYKRLCLLWHKMIQYVLYYNMLEEFDIDIGSYKIGFVFSSDENIKAQYLELDGIPTLLLNPDVPVSASTWRGTVLEVMDRAVHEITHRFHPYHDGSFMEFYNRLKSVCYMNINAFFWIGGKILKATKDNIVDEAELDESFSIEEDE